MPDSAHSLRSLSESSGSPPKLDSSTLALLDAFFQNKAEEERRFKELEAEQAAALIAGLALEKESATEPEERPMVSVKEFKLAFGEDWQLSQFWYSETSANRIAKAVHQQCTPSSKVAFVCCPTSFVAFQHMKPLPGARLLEFDQRFAVLAPKQFIPYDIDEPDVFPKSLKGHFDFIVADPPFLNEVTNRKLVQTLRQILHPQGKLLLMTSTSVEEVLQKVYDEPPIGPLKRTALEIEHGQLANDFACWGSWEGAEHFGEDLDLENGVNGDSLNVKTEA